MAEKLDLEALARSCEVWESLAGGASFISASMALRLIARIRELERAQVAAGYVLVPIEPTGKMIDAAIRGRHDFPDIVSGRKSYPSIETACTYRAMLAAAEAPNEERKGNERRF